MSSKKTMTKVLVDIAVYKDADGWWRWRMKHENGKIIGASTEAYKRRTDAFHNLLLVTGWEPRLPVLRGDREPVHTWLIELSLVRRSWQ